MSQIYKLTEEEKVNINRRMRMGFCLIKKDDLAKIPTKSSVQIIYTPELVPRQSIVPVFPPPQTISLTSLISIPSVLSQTSSIIDPLIKKDTSLPENLSKIRQSVVINENNKIRNTERLKAIVQKFKKHKKFTTLTSAISKAGRPQILFSLGRIQEQIKKHLHNLDSFKASVVQLLQAIKDVPTINQVAVQILAFFENLITEQKQIQFQTSLQDLQKNVDKITRQLGQTKQQGQWYYKKKRRTNDKFAQMKEMIYICDLIRQLPKAYLIGVWEVIYQKPFRELKDFKVEEVDISQLKPRKMREVEYYVKSVLTTLRKSKQKKKVKIEKKIYKQKEKLKELKKGNQKIDDLFTNNEKIQNNQVQDGLKKPAQQQIHKKQGMDIEQQNLKSPEQHQDQIQKKFEEEKQPAQILTEEQKLKIVQIQENIAKLQQQLQYSSSDSSMITDDEEDFD